jgi:flagellar basal-body rod modification protein FlgD
MDELENIAGLNDNAQVRQQPEPRKSELDKQRFADDFDDFLLLLTTQLQNQDPTEPLDTNEFTSQLVQFASVEQQLAQNANLEKLVEATVSSGVQEGLGFIGKGIEAPGDEGVLAGGQAAFTYKLDEQAANVDVTIQDERGQPVFSGAGATTAGRNTVVWDGINSFTNQPETPGTYQITVNAKDARGESIGVETFTTGRVSAAEVNEQGEVILTVGEKKIPVSEVEAVRDIPAVVPQQQAGQPQAAVFEDEA